MPQLELRGYFAFGFKHRLVVVLVVVRINRHARAFLLRLGRRSILLAVIIRGRSSSSPGCCSSPRPRIINLIVTHIHVALFLALFPLL